jgi:hypothetical protein
MRNWGIWLLLSAAVSLYGQIKTDINGLVQWDKMEIDASVSLDLALADIKLPAGRTRGEIIIAGEYLRLIRPGILSIPVDSSSTLGDLIGRGEYSLHETETLALSARMTPAALSPDLSTLSSHYRLSLAALSGDLIRHSRAAEIPRAFSSVPAPSYTGIIIIAPEELPVHGMNGSALVLPCLFPKIWDTGMSLIFERNMVDPQAAREAPIVRYAAERDIFGPAPSGLSAGIAALAGSNPLRILARGVFGIRPTDLIIDRADALLITSSEANRRLLREGRVVIVLNESVLTGPLEPGP